MFARFVIGIGTIIMDTIGIRAGLFLRTLPDQAFGVLGDSLLLWCFCITFLSIVTLITTAGHPHGKTHV